MTQIAVAPRDQTSDTPISIASDDSARQTKKNLSIGDQIIKYGWDMTK